MTNGSLRIAGLVALFVLSVMAAQPDVLGIENLSATYQAQDYSEVTFSVVNRSQRPILGYSVGLQFVSPDGQRTRDKALDGKRNMDVSSADFTVSSPDPVDPTARSLKDQMFPVGPLLPGRKQERKAWVRTGPDHPAVDLVVLFVVFEDNSVAGDIEWAKREFFKSQEAICAEYEWYLRGLRKGISESDGGASALHRLRENFRFASSETKNPVVFSKFALSYNQTLAARDSLYMMYRRIRLEQDAAEQDLERNATSPVEIVSQCITWAETRLAFHSGHLRPRY